MRNAREQADTIRGFRKAGLFHAGDKAEEGAHGGRKDFCGQYNGVGSLGSGTDAPRGKEQGDFRCGKGVKIGGNGQVDEGGCKSEAKPPLKSHRDGARALLRKRPGAQNGD